MTDKQSDIVAELREAGDAFVAKCNAVGLGVSRALEHRAADELERLRASNEAMSDALSQIRAKANALSWNKVARSLAGQIDVLAATALSHSATKETTE